MEISVALLSAGGLVTGYALGKLLMIFPRVSGHSRVR